MKCAFCGKDAKGTREHIISCSILDLFPECYITFDEKRNKIYQDDPIIKDVCAQCNNTKLSYIDSYAKYIVEKYFITKYKENSRIDFEYDYVLIQKVLLKYTFNDMRSRKDDISFFDSDIIEYLLDENNKTPKENITILAGLSVNNTPVPDYIMGNLKLRWVKNPIFMSNSQIQNIDYKTGKITLNDKKERQNLKGLLFSYMFRFNSGQFILMVWDKNEPDVEINKKIVKIQYPYTVLKSDCSIVKVERCTDEFSYHQFGIVNVNWGKGMLDEITAMRRLSENSNNAYLKKMNLAWKEEEKRLAQEHPRK